MERGRAVYGVNCNFCHGSDARGGEGGPNLLRSELVLNDLNGEGITGVIRNGRVDQGMPKFDLTQAQISDIAAFLHSFKVGGYDVTRNAPPTIVVGDAKAGQTYFETTCAKCHSTTGDLKAIGSKYADAKQLQQRWLMPNSRGGGGAAAYPITATVTPLKGKKVEGRLVRIDDFLVTVTDADGVQRTFERSGEEPKVELHDPLDPHKQLLRTYTDKDIHNVTAFLVGVK